MPKVPMTTAEANQLSQAYGMTVQQILDTYDAYLSDAPASPPAGSGAGGSSTPSPTGSTNDPYTSPGAVDVQPGLDWLYKQETLALDKYSSDLSASVQREQIQAQKDIAAINQAHQDKLAQIDADLQRELQAGRIDADKYMQERELRQRESEFSRNLALDTRAQQHKETMDNLNYELDKVREARAERELQASLAANPADFVKYEFYKRGLGGPQVDLTGKAQNLADKFLQEGGQPGTQPNQAERPPSGLGGAAYPAAPPAYSDKTIQEVASGIAAGQAPYNPALGGTGAFGAEVPSPNALPHSTLAGMDPTSLAILQSFIQGGVETNPGDPNSRVAISPEDWLAQAQRSWVAPTPGNAVTQYAA